MSSKNAFDNNMNYNTKRQKNNEASRNSRLKKKELEMEMANKKQVLEKTYVQLQKQINHIKSARVYV